MSRGIQVNLRGKEALLMNSDLDHSSVRRLLLRPAEAAIALGISRSRVYELLAAGELPCVELGSSRTKRIPVEALQGWIAKQLAATPAVDV
jgi:excisionase family DNA binding protein